MCFSVSFIAGNVRCEYSELNMEEPAGEMADSFEEGKSFCEPKNNGLLNGGAAPARLLSQPTRHTSLLSAVELN